MTFETSGDKGLRTLSESCPAAFKPSGVTIAARLPHPTMHRTYSCRTSRTKNGRDYQVYEGSHMRFVIDTVGRPLSEFRSTKELVMAIRDAIKGA